MGRGTKDETSTQDGTVRPRNMGDLIHIHTHITKSLSVGLDITANDRYFLEVS